MAKKDKIIIFILLQFNETKVIGICKLYYLKLIYQLWSYD